MQEQGKKPRYFYVGQTVYTLNWGKGSVSRIDEFHGACVDVDFENGCKRCFTFNGRLGIDSPIILSQTPLPEIKNTPLPNMMGLKDGDAVWVRDSKEQSWLLELFKEYSLGCEDGLYACYSDNCFDSDEIIHWVYCEKYDPETVENYR
jgi:hypothetical protein